MNLTRRNLLAGAAGGSLVSLAPGLNVAFGAEAAAQPNILVFLFLRFGMDGLQMVAPATDGYYRDARPTIAIRSSGPGAGLFLDNHEGVPFFMHPVARQLHQMYKDKKLAIIHAAGVPTQNRSHFETQEMVTHGLSDADTVSKIGWLTRHLQAKAGVIGDFDAVSDAQGVTSSLDGLGGSLSFSGLANIGSAVYGHFGDFLKTSHQGQSDLDQSVRKAIQAATVVREKQASIPPYTGALGNYTYGGLSNVLRPLAQVLKLDIGVQIATADFIGWDNHIGLSNSFFFQAQELSNALFAFTDDLGPLANRVTIVAMTEFGRRLRENTTQGTDHGAGSVMMVMGAGVNGGKFYGHWPGLAPSALDQGDLPVVTDYRTILSEILVRRQGQKAIGQVFPKVNYAPLGVVRDT